MVSSVWLVALGFAYLTTATPHPISYHSGFLFGLILAEPPCLQQTKNFDPPHHIIRLDVWNLLLKYHPLSYLAIYSETQTNQPRLNSSPPKTLYVKLSNFIKIQAHKILIQYEYHVLLTPINIKRKKGV